MPQFQSINQVPEARGSAKNGRDIRALDTNQMTSAPTILSGSQKKHRFCQERSSNLAGWGGNLQVRGHSNCMVPFAMHTPGQGAPFASVGRTINSFMVPCDISCLNHCLNISASNQHAQLENQMHSMGARKASTNEDRIWTQDGFKFHCCLCPMHLGGITSAAFRGSPRSLIFPTKKHFSRLVSRASTNS